jgi:hypothetical protein
VTERSSWYTGRVAKRKRERRTTIRRSEGDGLDEAVWAAAERDAGAAPATAETVPDSEGRQREGKHGPASVIGKNAVESPERTPKP